MRDKTKVVISILNGPILLTLTTINLCLKAQVKQHKLLREHMKEHYYLTNLPSASW